MRFAGIAALESRPERRPRNCRIGGPETMAGFLGLSVYIWLMLGFFIAMIATFVFGDIAGGGDGGDGGDGGGGGVSPLSLPIVAVFGTSFGGAGALLEATGLNPLAVAFGAALFALVVAGGMYVLVVRVFVKTQAETKVELGSLVGSSAQVTIPVAPGQTGQILVITEARGHTLIPAVAAERINTDEIVVIREIVGNAARVERKVGG